MLQSFLDFINAQQLLSVGQPTLLAVSGGLDSVVMADLFHRAGKPFGIAHVNYQLRGADSDADEVFVAQLARHWQVRFHPLRVDTKAYTHENRLSIQEAARNLRYDFFERLIADGNYGCVATAHHQNDLAETMLLNLVRGTGLAGLHGIPVRRGNIVRPLLFTNRAIIERYAEEQGLMWCTDASNATDDYDRNWIRHRVMPQLEALNPGLVRSMTATAKRLRSAETLLKTELARAWAEVSDTEGEIIRLDKQRLMSLGEPVFRLGEWLRPYGFREAQMQSIMDWLQQPDTIGQGMASATHRLFNERDHLLLLPLAAEPALPIVLAELPTEPVLLTDRLTLTMTRLFYPDRANLPRQPDLVWLDADALTWPLTLRLWQQTDRLQPFGMSGTKLVSNLLNDHKLTRPAREQTWVLLSGDEIVWVVGYRLAEGVRVRPETDEVLVIRLLIEETDQE
jgi:tRNA(Ile)-lysidine synthase